MLNARIIRLVVFTILVLASTVLVFNGWNVIRYRDEAFAFCSTGAPFFDGRLSIYSDWKTGRREDVVGQILTCTPTTHYCIKFPFLISLPPRVPGQKFDVVEWRINDVDFQFQMQDDKLKHYALTASYDSDAIDVMGQLTQPSSDPQTQASNSNKIGIEIKYYYSEKNGFYEFDVFEGGEIIDNRKKCLGKLSLDDLKAIG